MDGCEYSRKISHLKYCTQNITRRHVNITHKIYIAQVILDTREILKTPSGNTLKSILENVSRGWIQGGWIQGGSRVCEKCFPGGKGKRYAKKASNEPSVSLMLMSVSGVGRGNHQTSELNLQL